jgi:hypothetical protein
VRHEFGQLRVDMRKAASWGIGSTGAAIRCPPYGRRRFFGSWRLSLLVALAALWIAGRSDRRLEAISNLEFFEKQAAIASYISEVGTANDLNEVALRRLANDVAAIAALQEYASRERKVALIDIVLPALRRTVEGSLSASGWNLTGELIAAVRSYGVAVSELDEVADKLPPSPPGP